VGRTPGFSMGLRRMSKFGACFGDAGQKMRKKTNFYPDDELVMVVIKRKSIGSVMLEDVLPQYHKLPG